MKRILVVEDDGAVRFGMRDFLLAQGLAVDEADSCAAAEEAVRSNTPDAAVVAYRLPDGDALALLPRIKGVEPDLPTVILTGHGAIDLAVQAIQSGADQFLIKPVELTALHVVLQRLLEIRRTKQREAAWQPRRGADRQPFIGTSPAIRALEAGARSALDAGRPILIEGDTGCGKGVLAEWLHRNGSRADEAFGYLSCTGLSHDVLDSELFGHDRGGPNGAAASKPGMFEVAHHGTVFLDEISDMDLAVQAKLLKVIEHQRFHRLGDARERFVDVQVLASTHEDLLTLTSRKRFREDLYYRIGVVPLRVPPLRERREDILPVAHSLIEGLAIELGRPRIGLSPDAERALIDYRWPGNVRELRNVLERAVLRSGSSVIERAHLTLDAGAQASNGEESHMTLAEIERRHIERALVAENGHVERAAKRLGIPRSTLYQRLRQMGITSRRGPLASSRERS